MSIKIVCPTCGREYDVADALAGIKLQCKVCGATMGGNGGVRGRVAAAPPEPEVEAKEEKGGDLLLPGEKRPAVMVEGAEGGVKEPVKKTYDVFNLGEGSKRRCVAGRICIGMAVLVYLGAAGMAVIAVVVGAGVVSIGMPAGMATMVVGILAGMFLVMAGVGTTYLLCGIRIRVAGRRVPVIVGLVLGSLHALLTLLGLGKGMLMAPVVMRTPGMVVQWGVTLVIQGLVLAALAWLIVLLIGILREER